MATTFDISSSSVPLPTDQTTFPNISLYPITTSILENNGYEFSEEAKMILTVVISIVAIFGLFGNTMVILIVLVFSDMHTLINFSFANLALTDVTMLLLDAVPTATDTIGWNLSAKLGCNVPMYLQYIAAQATSLTLAFLSYDRYRLVVTPIQSYNTRSSKQMYMIMIIIWIASFVLQIPVALVPAVSPETGCNEFGQPWGEGIFFTYETVILYIIPLVVIIPCYTSIVSTMLHISSATTSNEDSVRYKRSTVRVIIVVIFFIVMWLPIHVVHMWMAFDPDVTAQTSLYIELHTAANVFMFLNSSVNPYLYAFGGSSNPFRKHLKDIVQSSCCGGMLMIRKKNGIECQPQNDTSNLDMKP
ncbi:G-protein coupled receptor 54-like [Amphiura filiformis]|uniref:G-protein coupled receptor 54-like n=1 Tax=Amphiura filiformis TaxID=82378 RepID=UPI003B226E2D